MLLLDSISLRFPLPEGIFPLVSEVHRISQSSTRTPAACNYLLNAGKDQENWNGVEADCLISLVRHNVPVFQSVHRYQYGDAVAQRCWRGVHNRE